MGIPWQGVYHLLHLSSALCLMNEKSVESSDMMTMCEFGTDKVLKAILTDRLSY